MPSPGTMGGMVGPNGAGKSTKIDMVLGLARPDAGSVTLSGKSPGRRGGRGHRRRHAADRVAAAGPDPRELVTMIASLVPPGRSRSTRRWR